MKNMKKELKNNKLEYLLILLICIQPIVDILRNYSIIDFELFGISIIEGVIFSLTCLALIATIVNNWVDLKKKWKWWLLIGIIYIIYIVLHLFNMYKYNVSAYSYAELNPFKEFYYIFRVYLTPLVTFLCLIVNKQIKKDTLSKTLKYIIIFITLVMVVSNLFKFGLVSYNVGVKRIKYNIFDWYKYKESYVSPITSRGLFYSGNQMSNVLLLLMPLLLFYVFTEKKISNYIILFCYIISMIMLGTRTGTYGFLLVCVVYIILIILYNLIFKENNYLPIIPIVVTIGVVVLGILPYSPIWLEKKNAGGEAKIELKHDKELQAKVVKEIPDDDTNKKAISIPAGLNNNDDIDIVVILDKTPCDKLIESDNLNSIIDFMKSKTFYYGINSDFVKMYPIEKDPVFWCERYNDSVSNNINSRIMKQSIIHRIYKLNNNPMDKYVGFGYNLGFMSIERDYVEQFYQFGIVGIILMILPYFIISIICGLKMLINKKINLFNLSLLMCIGIGFLTAYFSGHFYNCGFVLSMYLVLPAILYKSIGEKV